MYYTTDGSIPDVYSTRYTAPIHIQDATSQPNTLSMRTDITIDGATPPDGQVKKATIIRAVAIDADGNRSSVVTNTYFVGYQHYSDYQDISVLSIVTDPDDLFDEDNGIYVVGKMYRDWLGSDKYSSDLRAYDRPRNYAQHGKAWEIPALIQWFNEKEKLCLSQNVGLRIHGNQTREKAQKAFNLYARKEYGEDTFQYPLINGVKTMSKLVVRGQAGRDSITHSLLRETGLPVSGYTPCLVFINGEFWGFYELREKQEENYISKLFGIDKDNLMIYKNYRLIEGKDEDGKTNKAVYDNLVSKIVSNNPKSAEGYAYACQQIHMDNYITYMAAITYCNSEDIYWNKTLWKTMTNGSEPYEDGRWRWIFQDLDWTFYTLDISKEAIKSLVDDEFFMSLWKNPVFQKQFLTRIMDFANIELTPDYVKDVISPILLYYNKYFALNDERWNGGKLGYQKTGTDRINSFISFLSKRRSVTIERLKEILEISNDTIILSVNQIPEELELTVNDHIAHLYGSSWDGVYFSGCEVTFKVSNLAGYQFAGWYENGELLTDQESITVSTNENHSLTPVFDLIPDIAVMDRINYARSNYRGGYVLYKRNIKSNCVIVPDQALESSASFTDISISSAGEWKKGEGFTIIFPTDELSSCGMILYCTVPDGCPRQWALYSEDESGDRISIDFSIAETEDGLCFCFELPPSCMGSPQLNLHLESAQDYPGGTIRITKIRLYGNAAEETENQR
ncbi:MAG: CotH kinase family protein [Clostridia bacterium]|nr:CotH kinase family protein [Clostridia bacterium]